MYAWICLARKSLTMSRFASVCNFSWNTCQAPEGCWFLICCNREQQRGMAKYFHICMHDYSSGSVVLDPRATNYASRCMMAEESNSMTQYEMNAHMDTTRPRLHHGYSGVSATGNWDTFRHSGYETSLVSRAWANSYPKHYAICLICMNAIILCNLAYTMLWNGIYNARCNEAYTML